MSDDLYALTMDGATLSLEEWTPGRITEELVDVIGAPTRDVDVVGTRHEASGVWVRVDIRMEQVA